MLHRWDLDIYQVSALDFTQAISRKRKLFRELKVDLVFDVGANEGQFAEFLRQHVKYTDPIISVEPLKSAFEILERKAADDPRWKPVQAALGAVPGKATINISNNTQSSSLLEMLQKHRESAPDSCYVGSEEIVVTTLDILAAELKLQDLHVYLKIDTQGFEKSVLDGGAQSLKWINAIEMEVSFVPLYENQVLFKEMHEHMRTLGYVMTSIEPMFCDPSTGEILQADAVFRRRN